MFSMLSGVLGVISDNYFYTQGVVTDNEHYVSCSPEYITGRDDFDFNSVTAFLVCIRSHPILIAVLQRLRKMSRCPVFIDYITPFSVNKVVKVHNFYLILGRLSPELIRTSISHGLMKAKANFFIAAHASPMEWLVLLWALCGVDNKCIARGMNMTIKTVSHYKIRLANKMHLPEVNGPTLIKMMRVIYYICPPEERAVQMRKSFHKILKTQSLISSQ